MVAGFPCNQFGAQEPGSNSEIKRFATSTFGVSFPLFAKVWIKNVWDSCIYYGNFSLQPPHLFFFAVDDEGNGWS